MSRPLVQTQDHADVSGHFGQPRACCSSWATHKAQKRWCPRRTARKQVVRRAAAPDTPRISPETHWGSLTADWGWSLSLSLWTSSSSSASESAIPSSGTASAPTLWLTACAQKLCRTEQTWGIHGVPYNVVSRIFQSCIFYPWIFFPHFPVPHFPLLHIGLAFSSPAYSTPAYCSRIFQSCLFHHCSLVPHSPVPHFLVSHFQRPQNDIGSVVDVLTEIPLVWDGKATSFFWRHVCLPVV